MAAHWALLVWQPQAAKWRVASEGRGTGDEKDYHLSFDLELINATTTDVVPYMAFEDLGDDLIAAGRSSVSGNSGGFQLTGEFTFPDLSKLAGYPVSIELYLGLVDTGRSGNVLDGDGMKCELDLTAFAGNVVKQALRFLSGPSGPNRWIYLTVTAASGKVLEGVTAGKRLKFAARVKTDPAGLDGATRIYATTLVVLTLAAARFVASPRASEIVLEDFVVVPSDELSPS